MTTLLERLKTSVADRYLIERELGAGGMATVYLAQDLKHRRKVAVKVLRPELAAAIGSERFLREIETTANLQHPHILPLFDSGEADGLLYYVMPFIEGPSLRARLNQSPALTVAESVRIAREVANALELAHSRGVIHRDIKPENILLSGDHALVADFGIARAVTLLDPSQQTQTGLALGTPAYMSPEQALADSTLDARSDLYSLGCVLFEMLTGEPPFAADTPQRRLARRLTEPPPVLAEIHPEFDVSLSDLLKRVLAADPAERPATAGEVARLLESGTRLERVAVPPAEGFRIAVLPFKHPDANPDLEALAEGLSEGIVAGLSRFSYLRVIARGSTLRYANAAVDLRSVGKELGAHYLMEGNIRRAGAVVRIAVQIVDASTGACLWAQDYDRPFHPESIFELQDDLVHRIVSTAADGHGVLLQTMSQAVRSKGPGQLPPYEALLWSFGYSARITADEHAVTMSVLERAVQEAPRSADCWAKLSVLLSDQYLHFNGGRGPLASAIQAARRAVDTGPSNHSAHEALAWALFLDKEFGASRNAAERAIALNPMDSHTLALMGQTIAYAGDWETGCALLRRAMDLNPGHPGWHWYGLFLDAYRKREFDAALTIALKMNMPGTPLVRIALAASYGQLGEHEAGLAAVRELVTLRPDYAAAARRELGYLLPSKLVEQLIEGLRTAGLAISEANEPEDRAASQSETH